jgi:hypothetical protein
MQTTTIALCQNQSVRSHFLPKKMIAHPPPTLPTGKAPIIGNTKRKRDESRSQVESLSLKELESLGEALLDFSSSSDLDDWLRTLGA